MLARLQHPNIVRIMWANETSNQAIHNGAQKISGSVTWLLWVCIFCRQRGD
jgi:hypothetical protein